MNKVLPLPQGNHVATFGKDPIYRTKVIVRKPVCLTQSHMTARLETGVKKRKNMKWSLVTGIFGKFLGMYEPVFP